MGRIDIPGGMWIPHLQTNTVSTPGFAAGDTLDADGEKATYIFFVPRTGTVQAVGFRLGTVTQAPGNGLRVSFQDVTATGNPDEVQDQFRDVTSGLTTDTWVTTGLITSDGTDNGSKRSVTRGTLLAVVIEFTSFTAGDNLNVLSRPSISTVGGGMLHLHSYNNLKTGGTWGTKNRSALNLSLQYDDGTWAFMGPPTGPISALNHVNFSTSSNPDERGLIFQFPMPVTVGGGWFRGSLGSVAADLILYDADGSTVLDTKSMDGDQTTSASSANAAFCWFDRGIDLVAHANYRLILKPTTGSNVGLSDFEVPAAAFMAAHEGGAAWHFTQRTDGGAWSQTTTKRPMMGLLVTGIDDGGFRRSAMGRRRSPQTTLVR